ncbi:hypothetical protein I302_108851 [Kwoniella bestiolae CBS 10118]|uniref:Zn(2)-C6 fungal-type domain-containing protein n=1 Tax=Kwoniella bestiolae CBS 10118 TaxID=1296100 RepID=A0A1B9FU93_9TREE|nr:hypothetical protein I302_07989 [Kwoniella bestiolae CBS 10118]OCF22342.1 hypothetical protein I302_07989 [Kwoniella bestiolae CBS 10118]
MSSLPPTTTPTIPTEARAKRTHARRSCDVCKVRKTRCELPDLDVPSGPNPLPADKSCHRCRVLALPCIVDDSGKKQRKRLRDDPANNTTLANGQEDDGTPKRRTTKPKLNKRASSSSTPLSKRQSTVNHALDVLTAISPLPTQDQPASLDEATRIQQQPDLETFEKTDCIIQSKSMKLHGRPAELACAMFKVAYGKIVVKRGPKEDNDEVNLMELVDEQMKARLQPGFSQLKTFHPHLKSLEEAYKEYNDSPDVSTSLFLATVIYLSSLALPPDSDIQHIRTTLTPYITYLRDRVMLQLPRSFIALHALELLVVHAPLGVLPMELTSLKDLGVARGLLGTAKNLMITLEYHELVDQAIADTDPIFAFDCTDLWLWASLIADQATISFEDLNPVKPHNLAHARRITENFTNYNEQLGLWQEGIAKGDLAVLIGRLSVCDRLARSEEVLDTITNIKRALDISASNPTYDPVRGILNEFQNHERRMEDLDRRHDALIRVLAEQSRGVESGWVAYRSIRRRYETNKVYVTGLRSLIATHYLSGSPHAYPEIPPVMNAASAVNYAIQRAFTPTEIVRFITDTENPKPAVEAVWDWGRRRGVNTEACLVTCAELSQNLVNDLHNGVYAALFPLHDVMCIANEAAKVLIEFEAGTIQILRSKGQIHKAFRTRSWLLVMNQVSQAFRAIGALIPSDDSGGDSLANGFSNLIGSMVRSAEDWTKSLEQENDILNGDQHADTGTNNNPPSYSSVLDPGSNGNGNGNQPTNIHESLRQSSGPSTTGLSAGHNQYMDSSDRWMASEQSSSSSSADNHLQPQPTNYPPQPYPPVGNAPHPEQGQFNPIPSSALDHLLSEIFCYNIPSNQQQQQQQQQGQNGLARPAKDHHQNSWPAGSR